MLLKNTTLLMIVFVLAFTFSACSKKEKITDNVPDKIAVETAVNEYSAGFPSKVEKQKVIIWLWKKGLNKYSDPMGTDYPGSTPLYDEMTGKRTSRYDYILGKYPKKPWRTIDLEKEKNWNEKKNMDAPLDPRGL